MNDSIYVPNNDEKLEVVRRIKQDGGTFRDAINGLLDYMRGKDSDVTRRWCEEFVVTIWQELK